MYVIATEEADGVATMTISIADDDYLFDVWSEDGAALVDHQETCSWRGTIRTSEPDEDVFKMLMTSDEMMSLLDEWGVSGVKRAEPQH